MENFNFTPPSRIALISLYDTENNAVRLMAAILRKNGHFTVEIYFSDWRNNAFVPPTDAEINHLIDILKSENINLAALSLRASAYFQLASDLTRIIEENTGIPVLWGGAHVILCPEECIEKAHMICIGEGERAILELAERITGGVSVDDTPNIWVRRGDEIIRNPMTPLFCPLDELPFRDYVSPHKYVIRNGRVERKDPMTDDPVFQIMTTRGCPYQCSYCYNSTYREIFKGQGVYYRSRSVDNVIDELKLAVGTFKNLKRIKFDDEVFPFDEKWVDEFVLKYPKEVGLPFEAFTEPNLVCEERFSKLKSAGLEIIYMGIQNSARITGSLYDRATSDDQVKRAVSVLHRLGLDARYQVILDDPLSTSADKDELFKLLMDFERPFELYLFSLTVFPNTAIARKLLEDGIITEDQVEGKATKTFRQLRVDLSYPRDAESSYWAAMLVLLTKSFIPKGMLRAFYRSKWLRNHPGPLILLAQTANIIKMSAVAAKMLLKGELTWSGAMRWLNLSSLITQ